MALINKKIAITGLLSLLLIGIAVFFYQQYYSIPRLEDIVVDRADIRVLDGDTIDWKNNRIRLLGYDAPEFGSKGYFTGNFYGDQEPWATRATVLLVNLIDNASSLILLISDNGDKYGRYLGHLLIDGTPSGVYLIRGGYAYTNIDRYGHNGFPDEARQIIEAGKESTPHPFEDPHVWRRTHSNGPRPD